MTEHLRLPGGRERDDAYVRTVSLPPSPGAARGRGRERGNGRHGDKGMSAAGRQAGSEESEGSEGVRDAVHIVEHFHVLAVFVCARQGGREEGRH
eukprot:2523376-Rhodomonas_salina.1